MNSDTPTIEKLKQKVQSSGMKFERGGMNPLLQWSIENIIAPAMFRDKKEQGTLTTTEIGSPQLTTSANKQILNPKS